VLACPFCGAPETDRFDLEGQRFLVFRCLFSPAVDPKMSDEEVARHLRAAYRDGSGGGYFRQMCDRLHLYVTKGDGARVLRAAEPARPDGQKAADAPSD
jgi:hypothetical protein